MKTNSKLNILSFIKFIKIQNLGGVENAKKYLYLLFFAHL